MNKIILRGLISYEFSKGKGKLRQKLSVINYGTFVTKELRDEKKHFFPQVYKMDKTNE